MPDRWGLVAHGDFHDSADHAISVIAVRAGTARLWYHQDPDRSPVAYRILQEAL